MTNPPVQWYARLGFGIEFGPMPRGDLDELVETGQLLINDFVREGDEGEWIPARELPGLFPSDESNTGITPQPETPLTATDEQQPDFDEEEAKDLPDASSHVSATPSQDGIPIAHSLDEFDLETGPSPPPPDQPVGVCSPDRPEDLTHEFDSEQNVVSQESESEIEETPEAEPDISDPATEADTSPTWTPVQPQTPESQLPDPMAPVADRGPFPDYPEEDETDSTELESYEAATKSAALPDPLAPVSGREPFPEFPEEDESEQPLSFVVPAPQTAVPAAEEHTPTDTNPPDIRPVRPGFRFTLPRIGSLVRLCIAVALITGLWKLISGGPETNIYAEYSAIYSELQERRSNPVDRAGWIDFSEAARAQIAESNPWLEANAEPGDREKNLLLYAGRDMLELLNAAPDTDSPHQERLEGFFQQLSEIYGEAE